MPEPTVVSSFLWNLSDSVVFDAKFVTSAVVGVLGTAVTVQRNLSEISEGRSSAARKLENQRVAELLDMVAKVPPGDSFSGCRKELELQIAQSVRKLDALRAKESRQAEGPNRGLTLMQRLFVLFPPHDPSLWVIHALAYAFMAGGPVLILMLVLFGRADDAASIGDITIMVVFGSLAFRAWALAERKWAMQSLKSADGTGQGMQLESGPLQALFVLRKSVSWRMLVAQICMWTCLFCAVESLEDIFLSALDAHRPTTQGKQPGESTTPANTSTPAPKVESPEDPAKQAREEAECGLLLFLSSLVGAVTCRAWAAGEWMYEPPSPRLAFTKAIFPLPKLDTAKAWLLITSYVAAIAVLIMSVVAWSLVFKDLLDQAEFVFVSLAACVAYNRLLRFLGCVADCSKENKSAVLVQSAAA